MKQGQYHLLDAIRGISCIGVLIYHVGEPFLRLPVVAEQYPRTLKQIVGHADIGVLLFFVISGFCVVNSADASRKRGGKIFWKFLLRRVKRIYPAYWVALGCFIVVDQVLKLILGNPLITQSIDSSGFISWLGNFFLFEHWRFYLSAGPVKPFVVHSWSLAYEMQFYIVTAMALLCGRYFGMALVAVSLVSVIFLCEALGTGTYFGLKLFFDYHWLLFASGAGVYWVLRYRPAWTKKAAVLFGVTTLALVVVGAQTKTDTLLFLSAGLALAALLLAVYIDDEFLCQWLVVKKLCAVGKISYSLYLIHIIICVPIAELMVVYAPLYPFLSLLVAITFSLAISVWASQWFYRYFEEPWMGVRTVRE